MSSLRERLNRFHKSEADKPAPPPPESGEWGRIGAELHTSPWGSFVRRRRMYPLDSRHGRHRLRELADVAAELSAFRSDGAPVRAESLLFFDTETTGLGIGAGNVPFMIGVGYMSSQLFVVEQLLIRNPAEEAAMLRYLQELLGRFTHVVSYNGRTFDWPIVQSRFVLNRLDLDDSELTQLDFLYPSRSLWRYVLPSCRLSKVEESRLGFERLDDVPGSMAPALYFQYLAENDPAVLEGVFVHNEHDIVTLAALGIHLGKWLSGRFADAGEPDSAAEGGLRGMGEDELYRTGVWLDKMQRPEHARRVLDHLYARLLSGSAEEAAAGYATGRLGAESGSQPETLLLLAGFYKKLGVHARAAALWQRHIEVSSAGGLGLTLEPYVELAIHYEHREKNCREALRYADAAWQRLQRRRMLLRSERARHEAEEAALHKRLQRLKAKLAKQPARGGGEQRRTAGASGRAEAGAGLAGAADLPGDAGAAMPHAGWRAGGDVGGEPAAGAQQTGPAAVIPAGQPRAAAKPRRGKPAYAQDSLF